MPRGVSRSTAPTIIVAPEVITNLSNTEMNRKERQAETLLLREVEFSSNFLYNVVWRFCRGKTGISIFFEKSCCAVFWLCYISRSVSPISG
jgi:hypothetical protein